MTGAVTGSAAGVVSTVVGGVAIGVDGGVGFETRCDCFGALFAFASLIATILWLAAWSVTLVSVAATPDEDESEACFD